MVLIFMSKTQGSHLNSGIKKNRKRVERQFRCHFIKTNDNLDVSGKRDSIQMNITKNCHLLPTILSIITDIIYRFIF